VLRERRKLEDIKKYLFSERSCALKKKKKKKIFKPHGGGSEGLPMNTLDFKLYNFIIYLPI
jgi:hypothetical protein